MSRTGREGSITVFLSLLLPLVLALIGTLLEAARVQSVRAFLPQVTQHSMEMMFSDYNRELWEDYGLFAYTQQEEAEAEIKRAVEAAINPESGRTGIWEQGELDLWQVKLLELSIESKETMTDEDGEVLKHEAVEFMKYQMTEAAVEKILKLFHAIKETGAAASVAEKKLEAEEQLYEYSQEMLDFIEQIEGIDFGENSIEYRGELLKVRTPFVKQFFYGEPEKSKAGIKNELVLESLRGKFFDSKNALESLGEVLEELKEALEEETEGKERLAELEKEQEQLLQERNGMEQAVLEAEDAEAEDTQKEESKDVKGWKEEYKERILENSRKQNEILNKIDRIRKKIEGAEKRKTEKMQAWEVQSRKLTEQADNTGKSIEKALHILPELKKFQEAAAESVKKYGQALERKKTEVSEEMYQSFSEDCEKMASSVGMGTGKKTQPVCDLEAFERYLEENRGILQKIKAGIAFPGDISIEGMEAKENELEVLKNRAESYHIAEFVFSYEIIKKSKQQKNPADTLKKMANTSLLSLVAKDIRKLSQKSISGEENVFGKEETEKFLDDMSENITGISGKDHGIFSSVFGEFSSAADSLEVSDSVKEAGKELFAEIILNGYVQEMFYNYPTEEKNEKITALRYEQEYILSGQEIDKDNLASAAKKIAAVRTVCNFMALLTDTARQKEAYTAAVAIAGITGIEPLAEVLKSVILLVWAYEEAVVDTAALLQGKTLPVIKAPSQISLSFQELFGFGRNMVQQKAEACGEMKGGCAYSDYLYLFFCIQKQKTVLYRMADMIQFNMRERYDENFLLENAVFGCRVKGDYHMPWVFFRLPFMGWVTDGETEGWKMEVVAEKAY